MRKKQILWRRCAIIICLHVPNLIRKIPGMPLRALIFFEQIPNSPKVEECKKRINDLQEKLVEKSYLSAKLYYDMKQYKAAVVALN